ncbi:MAG TPA: TIGR00282 family metallophosphoesterase [Candidatus Obscuribacterales bacterium]
MSKLLRILFFGDIVGDAGRRVVGEFLSSSQCPPADLIIANAENCFAGGFGMTEKDVEELYGFGIHVLTGGNHTFHHPDAANFIQRYPTVLRPANMLETKPGRGWCVVTAGGVKIGIINLLGRLHMKAVQPPFAIADDLVKEISKEAEVIFVDFHATSTGEKAGLAHFLDGRVSAVVGTHTHVQTADECILLKGTAFISDVGACAATHSIIGMDFDVVLRKLMYDDSAQMEAARGRAAVSAVVLEIDAVTGYANSIERIRYIENRTLEAVV